MEWRFSRCEYFRIDQNRRRVDTGSHFHRLIPETKGRSLEEMDIIFGAVDAEKRKADIAQEEAAFEHVPPSPEADSVRSDFEKA